MAKATALRAMCWPAGGLLAAVCLALAPRAAAIPAPIPPTEAVRVTSAGVIWRDQRRLVLLRNGGVTLADNLPLFDAELQASGHYAAVGGAKSVLGGAPPSRLRTIARGAPLAPGGCDSWRAEPVNDVPFAVASDELIVVGTPTCAGFQPPAPRPLVAYSFATRRWQVLARLGSTLDPQLAASGHWLAVGVQVSPSAMHLRVLDLPSGKLHYQATVAPGYLDIDDDGEVVVAQPVFVEPGPLPTILTCCNQTYRVSWLSVRAPRVHKLAAGALGLPRISAGRVALLLDGGDQTSTLKVADLRTGRRQPIAGFRAPLRTLFGFDLQRNKLAWIQSETTALPAGQFTCGNGGQFEPDGPRGVVTANLANPIAPLAAPPAPPPLDVDQYIAQCGAIAP